MTTTIGDREPVASKPGQRNIEPDLLHRRRALKRSFIDARHEQSALEHILTLPAPGESLHFVIDGRFNPCDLIPATRRLSDPATIKELTITTLSYNLENVSTLVRGIDAGKIGKILLIPSDWFSKSERPLFAHTKSELESRGSRVAAGFVHTKLMLIETTDGNCYTIEGSGNLRSCKSIEQFVMTNDRELLEFHRGWIEKYITERTTYGRRAGRKSKAAAVAECDDSPSPDVDPGRELGASDS